MRLDPYLLTAILKNPEDDGARLAAGDWFEENDEPLRAEFVRLQMEMHRHRRRQEAATWGNTLLCGCGFNQSHTKGCLWLKMFQREKEITDSLQWKQWLPDLSVGVAAWHNDKYAVPENTIGVRFARGFAEAVICQGKHWLDNDKALLAAEPIRKVHLSRWTSEDEGRAIERFIKENPNIVSAIGLLWSNLTDAIWPNVKVTGAYGQLL